MKLIGIVRLGRDSEVRYTPDGTPVANFSGAFNYGRKGEDGNKPSQWVEFALWGERAEKLAEWLTKGRELFVTASDVHVETFEKRDGGSGAKLIAKVDDLQFTSGTKDQQQGGQAAPASRAPAPASRAPAPAARPPAQRQAPKSNTGFDDMDSDIPL